MIDRACPNCQEMASIYAEEEHETGVTVRYRCACSQVTVVTSVVPLVNGEPEIDFMNPGKPGPVRSAHVRGEVVQLREKPHAP